MLGSVKDRKYYFEQLFLEPIGSKQSKQENTSVRIRPSSECFDSSGRPPQKPKRTFEHDDNLILSTVSAGNPTVSLSSTSPYLAMQSDEKVPQRFDQYASSSLPFRRRFSFSGMSSAAVNDINQNVTCPESKHHPRLLYISDKSEETTDYDTKIEASGLKRKFGFNTHRAKDRLCSQYPDQTTEKSGSKLLTDWERRASRAQLVRKATVAHREKVAEFCGRAEPQLFEAALLIHIFDKETDGGITHIPKVDYCFPEKCDKDLHCMAELFFPDYSQTTRVARGDYWAGDEEFMVALTQNDGSRRYAYCIKFIPERRLLTDEKKSEHEDDEDFPYPVVLTVISPIRNSVFYMDLVRNAYVYARKGPKLLTSFLQSIFHHSYPEVPGSSLVVMEKITDGLCRRVEIKNYGTVMGRTGCSSVIARLTPEVTVCLIAALLGEQRVLIAGNSVGDTDICHPSLKTVGKEKTGCSTTRVVQMLEALIRPLAWPHTFIPMVPDNLTPLCDNPTPYLMGIMRYNLSKVRELIVEDKCDIDKRQMDFVFVDIDTGLVNPPPFPIDKHMNLPQWRLENSVSFCERLGWPRKMCTNLVRSFRDALNIQPTAAADLKIETAMLRFYSDLFGHYRFVGAHESWNADSRRMLVEGQPDKAYRPFLAYLIETAIFEEWISTRRMAKAEPFSKEKQEKEPSPLPGSEEELNMKLDRIWLQDFNSFTPRPFSRMVNKVQNIVHIMRKSSNQ